MRRLNILFLLSLFCASIFAQELNKYNTIVIERARHERPLGIAERIEKVFAKKGFRVIRDITYENLPPRERITALRCRYSSNIVYGAHSTLEIVLSDYYGNEIMNLYGDGISMTAKGDMKIAARKALRPIVEMEYEFNPKAIEKEKGSPYSLKGTALEDSIRKIFSEKHTDPIEGIYKSIGTEFNRCAVISMGDKQYKLMVLGSDVAQWDNEGVIAMIDYIRDDLYAITTANNMGTYVQYLNGLARYENNVLVLVSGDNSSISFVKIYPVGDFKDSKSDNGVLQNAEKWSGTGFALNNGYIVTNNHVVEESKSISVFGVKGDLTLGLEAKVVGTDKVNDLALLKITSDKFSGFGSIPYSINMNMADTGEDVFVLGYPLTQLMGNEIKLTNGIISSKSGFEGNVNNYQISAPVQPGNSGGPMFDHNGCIIGIIVAKIDNEAAQNVNYAVKTSCLKNLIESVVDLNIVPINNMLNGMTLTERVKRVKDFIFYIECSK